MNESGLWELFFQTGLPEVWLALREPEAEEEEAVPAFVSRPGETSCG